MSFLCDSEIQRRLHNLIPAPHEKFKTNKNGRLEQLQPSSFELRLGEEVYLSVEKELIKLGNEPKLEAFIKIKPGEFAILMSHESVDIPIDLMAFISCKTKFKKMGLINVSGFHVDPGFKGKLHFSVYNAGTSEIILRYLDPIFVIFFATLGQAANPYSGDHQNQKTIPSDAMNMLSGKSVSIADISDRLNSMELTVRIQWGLLFAMTVGLIIALLRTLVK